MAAVDKHFDINRLNILFNRCLCQDGLIHLDSYIDAYEELCKLFGLLGSIFSFVTADVVEKIEILREYRKSEKKDHYENVKAMIDYEIAEGITNNKKQPSGARTLLRLHRAMEFTAELMLDVRNATSHESMASITKKAYDCTLSKHHPWLVRKGVHVAVYTLPSRQHLIEKMKIKDEDTAAKVLLESTNCQKQIFEIVEDIFTTHKLHSLP